MARHKQTRRKAADGEQERYCTAEHSQSNPQIKWERIKEEFSSEKWKGTTEEQNNWNDSRQLQREEFPFFLESPVNRGTDEVIRT